jgi:2,3-bisphosphoglycerate-independent phosphoglycerate mutase
MSESRTSDPHLELLSHLAEPSSHRILLLVLDGLGDVVTLDQPRTALERATTPNLDALAARSALGRLTPVTPGVTPGSGPGHLGLFGYDVTRPEVEIGRGVLEALGLDLDLAHGEIAARGNFATADREGRLTDRRAGRIPTSECRRLAAKLRDGLAKEPVAGLDATVEAGEGHRFVLLLRGEGLSPDLADTDPQQVGVPPLEAAPIEEPGDPETARATAEKVRQLVDLFHRTLADEERANRTLLRGFSTLPHLPSLTDLYGLRCGAFAAYPLYRGVAKACGMRIFEVPKDLDQALEVMAEHQAGLDFVFFHVKPTDAAGEDGNVEAKARVIEEVDRHLPKLLEPGFDVVAVTGDHSTPAPMKSHGWHPVPLLLHGPFCFIDDCDRFDEKQATRGHLGTFPSRHLMGLLLANAGRLAKFGA